MTSTSGQRMFAQSEKTFTTLRVLDTKLYISACDERHRDQVSFSVGMDYSTFIGTALDNSSAAVAQDPSVRPLDRNTACGSGSCGCTSDDPLLKTQVQPNIHANA
jgi:hypothetical protein